MGVEASAARISGKRLARGHHSPALSSLAPLDVVYGDIGTSPLYALRACFWAVHACNRFKSVAQALGP